MTDTLLPPLPVDPPDLLSPPNPALDPHAYNWWLTKTENYKWPLAQHKAHERMLEQRAARQAVVAAIDAVFPAAADYFDSVEKGRQVTGADVFMELLRQWKIRPGDTEGNLVTQIDKAAQPIIAHLRSLRVAEGAGT